MKKVKTRVEIRPVQNGYLVIVSNYAKDNYVFHTMHQLQRFVRDFYDGRYNKD